MDTGKRFVESAVRRGGRGLGVPALRPGGGRGLRTGRRHGQRRRGQPDRARAGRSLRPDHAVELPAAPGRPGRSPRAWPPGNTFVLKPSELTPHTSIRLMRLLEEAGLPPGVGNLVLGAGAAGGCAARRGPAGRPGVVHRRAGDRPARDGRGGRHGQEGRARARRQEPQHRLRRRRPRGGARLRADGGLPALRPGLLGRRPAARRESDPRPVRRRAGRAGAGRSGSADPHDAEGRDRTAHQRRAPRQGRGVRRGRASPRVRCCAAAGERPDDPALADGFYYLPTMLDRCTSDMSVTQDESFGPVLTVETFNDEDEAVADRQRQHLRPGGRGLDRRTPAGPQRVAAPAADGHRVDQRLPPRTCPRPSGAATSSPVSAASSATPGWTSTARPSTSGTTSARPSRDGSAHDRRRDVRRRHRRRRLGRLRAGEPAVRRPRATSVLVLEAGRSDWKLDPFIHMPAALPFPIGSRFYDWRYETDPEPALGRPSGRARARQDARRLLAASTG